MKVYVVHGSPLSGKSTYVQNHAGNNDIIFDYDLIISALSGRETHDHNPNLKDYVIEIRNLIIRKLKYERNIDNAWIIISNLSRSFKSKLAGLDVEYIHMKVSPGEARRRLEVDPDGRDKALWSGYIDSYGTRKETIKDVSKFYNSYEWQKTREAVRERDHNECQMCKAKGKYSTAEVVHHIKHLKDRPDLRLDMDNLISLCNECHNDIHEHGFNTAKKKKKRYTNPERW